MSKASHRSCSAGPGGGSRRGVMNWFDSRTLKKHRDVVKKNPDDPQAHFELGVEYEKCGRLRDAAGQFEETLRIQPRSAEAHFNLSVLYESLKEGKKAIDHMLQAGNLFKGKNDEVNKDKARQKLREYYRKFGYRSGDSPASADGD